MCDAQTLTAPAAAPQGLRRTPYRRLLKIASHHKIGAAAFGGVIIVCLLALTAPIIAPYDPFEQDYNSLLQAPSWAHPFGTDRVGRDILTRVLYGTQVSVLVGLVAVGISIAIGVPLGLLSGFMGGVVDNVIMRFMDALIAFPRLILALAIVAVLSPGVFQNLRAQCCAVGIGSMPVYARLMRSQALAIRENQYIEAAHSLGVPSMRVMYRHILPNAVGPVLVNATFGVAAAVLVESALSFLGFGDPTLPSWGRLLAFGRTVESTSMMLIAGFAIFVTVSLFNLAGEGIRDALDPKLRK